MVWWTKLIRLLRGLNSNGYIYAPSFLCVQVFLHATTSKKQAMQLKMRNIEWWMRKRQLPMGFRQRVRNYERQRWAAMRGVDECEMIRNLPEGLRRDIKYHLCLDLVRQVYTSSSLTKYSLLFFFFCRKTYLFTLVTPIIVGPGWSP